MNYIYVVSIVGHSKICCLIVIFCVFFIYYLLITRFTFLLCLFSCFVCYVACFVCSVLLYCVFFLLMCRDVSFLFVYKFTDHSERVETHLQLRNNGYFT